VFEYFDKKDSKLARTRTVNFMVLLEVSTLMPLFIIVNSIFRFYQTPENPNADLKYLIGIPLGALLIIANGILLKNKLTKESLKEFKYRFSTYNKFILWLIFITPIVFVFVIPIIYGTLNGTLRIVGH